MGIVDQHFRAVHDGELAKSVADDELRRVGRVWDQIAWLSVQANVLTDANVTLNFREVLNLLYFRHLLHCRHANDRVVYDALHRLELNALWLLDGWHLVWLWTAFELLQLLEEILLLDLLLLEFLLLLLLDGLQLILQTLSEDLLIERLDRCHRGRLHRLLLFLLHDELLNLQELFGRQRRRVELGGHRLLTHHR